MSEVEGGLVFNTFNKSNMSHEETDFWEALGQLPPLEDPCQ